MKEFCPKCKTELEHIQGKLGEDVYGCPKCNKEIPYAKSVKQQNCPTTKEKIKNIVRKYGIKLISLIRNVQGTFDIELDQFIDYKAHARMEKEIRELGNINDIYYRDIG